MTTKQELIEKWMEENDISGDTPWFDPSKTYYNLRADQIIRVSNFLNSNKQ